MTELERVNRCVIITGLSGAGKTTALNILEDHGFYTVDNIPPSMMPELMSKLAHNRSAVETGVAAVVDVREGDLLQDIFLSIEVLKSALSDVKLLFLDASNDSLVKRFETTRRRHPLGAGLTILESVARERRKLEAIRTVSDIVLDTSQKGPNDLRGAILSELGLSDEPQIVIVSSFGFKNGAPMDCDYAFDVRFLPNPNYVAELKKLSGRDEDVQLYLDKNPQKKIFVDMLESLLAFILTQYEGSAKKLVHIAIGCTGGRHRSVAIAEETAGRLSARGHNVITFHRDINMEAG
jgi:UPF0042 nucleotide-binding protein